MAKLEKLDLSKKTLDELNQLLVDKKADLFVAKKSLVSDNLVNTQKISQIKRQIAQIKTKINLIINNQTEEEK